MSAAVISILPKGRGQMPRAPRGSRSALKLFPNWEKDFIWLYAVGFAGGITKIGRTKNPRARLQDHWSKAKGEVEWVHLFGKGDNYFANLAESQAIRLAADCSERIHKSEWFRGLPKPMALKVVREAIAEAREAVERERLQSIDWRYRAEIEKEVRAEIHRRQLDRKVV